MKQPIQALSMKLYNLSYMRHQNRIGKRLVPSIQLPPLTNQCLQTQTGLMMGAVQRNIILRVPQYAAYESDTQIPFPLMHPITMLK